jgi:hypothetical protein
MTDAISNLQQAEHTALRKVILFCFVLTSAFTVTACQAKGPEMVGGLGVELLNYSQESVYSVSINGSDSGVHWATAAKIGGVEGGGQSCCSGKISAIKNTADVSVKTNHGTYTTQAQVELPFPDLMDTLIIHILPGRKVVLEVTPGNFFPRQDLMDEQIKALGLKKEHEYTGPLRSHPKYTEYYKPE